MRRLVFLFFVFLFFLSSCLGRNVPPLPTVTSLPSTDTATPFPPATETGTLPSDTPMPTALPTLAPDAWVEMPVIPTGISPRVVEIYLRGLALGNNPQAFSKVGDCDATTTWFLGDFDAGPDAYSLGEYSDLQPVIDYFQGSWGRNSVAVKRGFTAASVLTPLWADPALCQANETPLACELRLHRPSFALILLGTNDVNHQEVFEANMRAVLDTLIANGVVPVLATKADNLEGDHEINATIARLAYEYQVPLWNFWLAVQPLPGDGLQEDGAHLTFAGNRFDDPDRMQAAWPWRNLTALQTLDLVWKGVTGQP
jgi:hypothetical protein